MDLIFVSISSVTRQKLVSGLLRAGSEPHGWLAACVIERPVARTTLINRSGCVADVPRAFNELIAPRTPIPEVTLR